MVKRLVFFIGKIVFSVLPLPSGLRVRAIEKAVDYYTIVLGWMGENPSVVVEKAEAESPYSGLSLPTAQDELYIAYEAKVPLTACPAKVIAFYLPQFHTIPENDEWWGEGFTEWTNVKPAKPQFDGHYQPRIPGELGYYNLLDAEVQARQVELAKNYGIGGFCFHFYWFDGKRLLEQPILNYLENKKLDLPFCLSWANENWSRRWDGRESDVLIQQNHSPEDDVAFIRYVSAYLDDPRYIRISGKPLLIVYRPGILPDARETVSRWRSWYRTHKGGELYIACTHSFETVDPNIYGMDAALEFPPNNSNARLIDHEVRPLTLNFQSVLYDWRSLPARSMPYATPDYTLFRGVCPSWDNTARRKNKGTVFLNNSPKLYKTWLQNAIEDTISRLENPDERIVFVNAWNEWAEGAYLEPDRKYGYAYLEATWDALQSGFQKLSSIEDNKLILVSHDAHLHGAQLNAVEMARVLVNDFKINVEIIVLSGGILVGEFQKIAKVHDFTKIKSDKKLVDAFAQNLYLRGFRKALLNTTVSGSIIESFSQNKIDCISLIHELPDLIKNYGLQNECIKISRYANKIVFPHKVVLDGFLEFTDLEEKKVIISPQGLYKRNPWRYKISDARNKLRKELNLSESTNIILNIGYADYRKGVDLFIDIGCDLAERYPDMALVWVGNIDINMRHVLQSKLKDNPFENKFHFIGFKEEVGYYYAGADLFVLTSREDPFPSVILESYNVGLNVIAFKDSGGVSRQIEETGLGCIIPKFDVRAFTNQIITLLENPVHSYKLGLQCQDYVDKNFSFRKYLFHLCELFNIKLPKVSIIVPNYNYSNYILNRLNSIIKQTIGFYELIVLDDASVDSSIETILEWMDKSKIEINLIINKDNSGSVMKQWEKGVLYASGEYIWIAEADDLSDTNFLKQTLAPFMNNPELVMSYCESKQIDENDNILAEDYSEYVKDASDIHWNSNYEIEGTEEVKSVLAVLNTIPNVSGVLFKSSVLKQIFLKYGAELKQLQKAGDYLLYVRLLKYGHIFYNKKNLNFHRRHSNSIIAKKNKDDLYNEIVKVQKIIENDYNLDSTILKMADNYRQKLREQFLL